ncbi:MAG TPA: FliG C-terminal domain-containing protein [Bdellovibrionales bacterium]|nr:FliG C-terminal domain-containing protein [Bdellovibrionales bacterium]
MSMLARFKKPGGFIQLVNLIETCTDQKKEQLLKAVEGENPAWAKLLKEKLLTVDKVFSWPPEAVAEITTRLPERIVAIAMHGLKEDVRPKATFSMSHMKLRAVEEVFNGYKPNAGEISAAFLKIIMKARELEKGGELKLDKIDPNSSLTDVKAA